MTTANLFRFVILVSLSILLVSTTGCNLLIKPETEYYWKVKAKIDDGTATDEELKAVVNSNVLDLRNEKEREKIFEGIKVDLDHRTLLRQEFIVQLKDCATDGEISSEDLNNIIDKTKWDALEEVYNDAPTLSILMKCFEIAGDPQSNQDIELTRLLIRLNSIKVKLFHKEPNQITQQDSLNYMMALRDFNREVNKINQAQTAETTEQQPTT